MHNSMVARRHINWYGQLGWKLSGNIAGGISRFFPPLWGYWGDWGRQAILANPPAHILIGGDTINILRHKEYSPVPNIYIIFLAHKYFFPPSNTPLLTQKKYYYLASAIICSAQFAPNYWATNIHTHYLPPKPSNTINNIIFLQSFATILALHHTPEQSKILFIALFVAKNNCLQYSSGTNIQFSL